jgi:hypothetical protein
MLSRIVTTLRGGRSAANHLSAPINLYAGHSDFSRPALGLVAPLNQGVESFPAQFFEIADISPIEGTIGRRKCRFVLGSPRNRSQEADGSIPFISTILLLFLRRRAPR